MEKSLNNNIKNLKLHLGCGERYLDGYVNIDYPSSIQSVQNIKADRYEDILNLDFPKNSIEEIRLHHVFEHFSRPIALALVCRWRDWLKPNGLLRIETPDAQACCKKLSSRWTSYSKKQKIMRHLFGSHEAFWAVHMDGWYKDKFIKILSLLGFYNLNFKKNKYYILDNIEVIACKSKIEFRFEDYFKLVKEILIESSIKSDKSQNNLQGSELIMLNVWLNIWRENYFKKDSMNND